MEDMSYGVQDRRYWRWDTGCGMLGMRYIGQRLWGVEMGYGK